MKISPHIVPWIVFGDQIILIFFIRKVAFMGWVTPSESRQSKNISLITSHNFYRLLAGHRWFSGTSNLGTNWLRRKSPGWKPGLLQQVGTNEYRFYVATLYKYLPGWSEWLWAVNQRLQERHLSLDLKGSKREAFDAFRTSENGELYEYLGEFESKIGKIR